MVSSEYSLRNLNATIEISIPVQAKHSIRRFLLWLTRRHNIPKMSLWSVYFYRCINVWWVVLRKLQMILISLSGKQHFNITTDAAVVNASSTLNKQFRMLKRLCGFCVNYKIRGMAQLAIFLVCAANTQVKTPTYTPHKAKLTLASSSASCIAPRWLFHPVVFIRLY